MHYRLLVEIHIHINVYDESFVEAAAFHTRYQSRVDCSKSVYWLKMLALWHVPVIVSLLKWLV